MRATPGDFLPVLGDDVGVPASLHDWVELWFGAVPRQSDAAALVEPLLRFNHVPPEPWIDRGVEVLVVENQGVWLWGRRDGGFVERENVEDAAWQSIAEDAEGFWLHHAAFEALWSMGANRSALQLNRAAVSQIEDACAPLPCGEWSWPGRHQRVWHRSGSLAMICEDSDGDGFWVVVAARTEEELSWLDSLALEWDEFDSRVP